jgi:hypothetical protein
LIIFIPLFAMAQVRFNAAENRATEYLDYQINSSWLLPQFVLRHPLECADSLLSASDVLIVTALSEAVLNWRRPANQPFSPY